MTRNGDASLQPDSARSVPRFNPPPRKDRPKEGSPIELLVFYRRHDYVSEEALAWVQRLQRAGARLKSYDFDVDTEHCVEMHIFEDDLPYIGVTYFRDDGKPEFMRFRPKTVAALRMIEEMFVVP